MVISGVSRGIGLSLALNLLEKGCRVYGISRCNQEDLDEKLRASSKFVYIQADLALSSDFDKAAKQLGELSSIFLLVNNAAVLLPPCQLEQHDFAKLEMAMRLNLDVPMKLAAVCLPHMSQNSRILNLSSRAATTVVPQLTSYCVAKAGIDMFTRMLRAEVKARGIGVAGVIPGEVDTGMQETLRTTEGFVLRDNFIKSQTDNKLIAPWVSAKFLAWLTHDLTADEFNATGEDCLWDIYNESHHDQWKAPGDPFTTFPKDL